MNSTFDFRLMHPDGPLSHHVQAIWSASISPSSDSISKPLFSDGASGIFFNIENSIIHDGISYGQGLIYTPVKHHAEFIIMSPGSRLVGFRFQPGVSVSSFELLNELFNDLQDIQCVELHNLPTSLKALTENLIKFSDQDSQINLLTNWLLNNVDQDNVPPRTLIQLLANLKPENDLQAIQDMIPLSLRQLERQFKSRVGMTPKYYQRLMRVRTAIEVIKQNPVINLVDLAVECGFSDQAHMTREFRQLAKMTPGQYQLGKVQKG